MNNDDKKYLALTRCERADQLLDAAKMLLEGNDYKSANNRAFYCAEMAIKAALAVIGKSGDTHNGILKTFNMEFIHKKSPYFSTSDYKILTGMGRIRQASDYDDFYIANKAECETQVKDAEVILEKVKSYLTAENIL